MFQSGVAGNIHRVECPIFIDTARTVCGRASVTIRCLSVCPSVRPILRRSFGVFGGFAAVGPAGRRYQSTAARRVCSRRGRLSIHIHSSTAVSSKCEQCRVYSDLGS